ncbi:DJ-1/PfpI family protein [Opitutus terrae]|nr:DJ-1/PfpI family protein [Opitutus terrae]
MNKIIALVIAPGEFRDEEYIEPKTLFEQHGARTVTISTTLEPVTGMLGATVQATLLLKDAQADNFDAVVFVGGMGARRLYHEPEALRLARQAVAHNKVVGAICLAPNILAQAGVLKNRRATAWAFEVPAAEAVNQVGESVVRDGRIITANGPQAATPFAQAIAELLLAAPTPQ